jgi:hypothetical protein
VSRPELENARLDVPVDPRVTGERHRKERLSLTVVPASGHAAWWTWVIRDDVGALVEASSTHFRVAADAEKHGAARLAMLEEHRRRGFTPSPWPSSAR